MAFSFDEQALLDMLAELQEAETADWVAAVLYEVGVDELLEAGGLRNQVGRAFAELLHAEIEYHRELESLLWRQTFDTALLALVNRRRHELLKSYLERLAAARPSSAAMRGVRDLALARCYLGLGYLEEAAAWLEAAAADGVGSPLLFLALGHTRYQEALVKHARTCELNAVEWLSFQMACLGAVRCFQAGLGKGLDGQLYWWIGAVLEAAGFQKAAEEAYDRASAAEEDVANEYPEDGLLDGELSDADLPDDLPEITPLEERRLLEDLRKPLDLRWLEGDEDEPDE